MYSFVSLSSGGASASHGQGSHVREIAREGKKTYSCLRWVKGGLGKYLIDRTALAYLNEIFALDDVSGSGGSAAQICST